MKVILIFFSFHKNCRNLLASRNMRDNARTYFAKFLPRLIKHGGIKDVLFQSEMYARTIEH